MISGKSPRLGERRCKIEKAKRTSKSLVLKIGKHSLPSTLFTHSDEKLRRVKEMQNENNKLPSLPEVSALKFHH